MGQAGVGADDQRRPADRCGDFGQGRFWAPPPLRNGRGDRFRRRLFALVRPGGDRRQPFFHQQTGGLDPVFDRPFLVLAAGAVQQEGGFAATGSPAGGTMPDASVSKIRLVAQCLPEQPPRALDGVQVARHARSAGRRTAPPTVRGRSTRSKPAIGAPACFATRADFSRPLRVDDEIVTLAAQCAAQRPRLAPRVGVQTGSCASA